MSRASRILLSQIGGALIILLALGAALLPLAQHIPARTVISLMLIAAGGIELAAVLARPSRHIAAIVAAGATVLAGLRLGLDPRVNFLTILNLVILWLVVRAAALFFSGRGSPRPICNWIWLAAAVDFALAVLLLGGLPVAVLVYGLFGTVNQVVATFAWIFAASFVASGWLLIACAPREAKETPQSSG